MVPYKCSCPKRDLILGSKRLSLLEFETWELRPLGHHNRLLFYYKDAQKVEDIISFQGNTLHGVWFETKMKIMKIVF